MILAPILLAGSVMTVASTTNIDIPHDSAVRAVAIASVCDKAKDYASVISVISLAVGLDLEKPTAEDSEIIKSARGQYKGLTASGRQLACKLALKLMNKAQKEIEK